MDGEEQKTEDKIEDANGKAKEWNGKLTLRKKVMANGEMIEEITFREPTGADIERVGNPPVSFTIFDNNPAPRFDAAAMSNMMSTLAGVPPSTIRAMHPKDWMNGAYKLLNFFTPDL